ncbi:unnamed protein product [Gulo gulo]|uniref:Uncharacterized protein n=1 Tax=Gulo gulo TaxID=48420 RepID=A0A9X9PVR6_GULGU|nr:unnamed protein product [Gulo gulo]
MAQPPGGDPPLAAVAPPSLGGWPSALECPVAAMGLRGPCRLSRHRCPGAEGPGEAEGSMELCQGLGPLLLPCPFLLNIIKLRHLFVFTAKNGLMKK